MEKIANYVRKGRGIGFIFLFAAAVLVTLIVTIKFKDFAFYVSDEITKISGDFLPITVDNGKIVSPSNTYIRKELKFGEDKDIKTFPVVLDTRAETSVIPSEDYGFFVMTDSIYMIAKNEIKKISLSDGTINQEIFNKKLDATMGSIFFVVSVFFIIVLCFNYLLETLLAAGIGYLFLKSSGKDEKYEFTSLMRLNSILVALLEVVIGALFINISFVTTLLIAVLMQFYYLYKNESFS